MLFEIPDYTAQVDALGTLRFLDAIRESGLVKHTKFYQALTSELFGKVQEIPQNENTPFYPRSPYGVAKLYGFWVVKNYREAYGLFAVNGILFNHESPRRGETFVTRKITRAVSRIFYGLQQKVTLGNLDAKRDWGYAPEYCEGMWRILQHSEPEDFVLATGETHTIREFCELAFKEAGIELEWQGKTENEIGVVKSFDPSVNLRIKSQFGGEDSKSIKQPSIQTDTVVVSIDPVYYRPTEVDLLIGDSSKAKSKLGWEPRVKFEELIKIMMKADLEKVVKRGY